MELDLAHSQYVSYSNSFQDEDQHYSFGPTTYLFGESVHRSQAGLLHAPELAAHVILPGRPCRAACSSFTCIKPLSLVVGLVSCIWIQGPRRRRRCRFETEWQERRPRFVLSLRQGDPGRGTTRLSARPRGALLFGPGRAVLCSSCIQGSCVLIIDVLFFSAVLTLVPSPITQTWDRSSRNEVAIARARVPKHE